MAAQTVSTVRAAALRNRCLSLANTCSIGFRSGEYFGSRNSLAPAERMSWRMILIHCARRRATSGRSRSPATTLFFKAELLVVDKSPDRAVVNLQTALGELAHQPEQGEVLLLDPCQQPSAVLARDRAGLVAADLA